MSTKIIAAVFVSAVWILQTPQQPTIRSGVELVLIDAQVTGRDGLPMHKLTADQFEVTIDGKKRPVVNADFIEFGKSGMPAPALQPGGLPPIATPDAIAREGRVIAIGVDQASLQIHNEQLAREAIIKIMEMANPEDAIGLFGVPLPGANVSPTRDRAKIRAALPQIGGQNLIPRTRLAVSVSEAIDLTAGDGYEAKRVGARECPNGGRACHEELERTVKEISMSYELQAIRSINGLQALMTAAKEYPGRKIVVIISAGFPTTDRVGGRPDVRAETTIFGKEAAEANAVVYALRLDVAFMNAFNAGNGARHLGSSSRDSQVMSTGLQRFTASAGGTYIDIPVGPDPAIKQFLRETSAYSLLGVEALPEHRDGKLHYIRVKVKQGEVRARNGVVIPKAK